MAYIDPATVVSPRSMVQSVDVIYDTGPIENSWSVALLNGGGAVGVRWNGNDTSSLGNPQSRANPTWFVLPDELATVVRERAEELNSRREGGLLDGYRAMAQDRAREAEAQEWSEGLISDAIDQER